ncbi:cobalt-precorrin-5B (C(1))-methyltransferase [Ahrensia sp. R2A130]|uniref:cobalt-precorrin-5B (C(1))-methyltransferase n=1 Tax=Ahrensia sp. R2A130 TaxID=744979 RepID=UPI00059019F9|nr:cobalt-precorrin-5B (C(1))-methyltransferase [Ahrensia sp. R2A130]
MARDKPSSDTPLKRGWTTGACATAATKAALTALITAEFPDPVTITLPKGETPAFPLCYESLNEAGASAGIVKDAGDDPDVTHGATIISTVRPLPEGSGVVFCAGEGVGMVTKAGLPIPPGEPAINPVPRQMMRDVVAELCGDHLMSPDLEITISVPDGAAMAEKTWNGRLGIVGGLSILGTTGIVHPFSCAAWIHSIHRGIDVAREAGYERVIAATGSTSEDAAQRIYELPETALLDMGDFAGGLLKYLRVHPVPAITLAGGFAKFTKLAQGALDLHSGRSQVDFMWLAGRVDRLIEDMPSLAMKKIIRDQILGANTAAEVLTMAQSMEIDLPKDVAREALTIVKGILRGAAVDVEVLIVDRQGEVIARER